MNSAEEEEEEGRVSPGASVVVDILTTLAIFGPRTMHSTQLPPGEAMSPLPSLSREVCDIHYVKHERTSLGSAITKIYDSGRSTNEVSGVCGHDSTHCGRTPTGRVGQSWHKLILVTVSFGPNDVRANNAQPSNQSPCTVHAVLLTRPDPGRRRLVWSALMWWSVSGQQHSVHASLCAPGVWPPSPLSLTFIAVPSPRLIDSGDVDDHRYGRYGQHSAHPCDHHHHPVQSRAMNINEQNLTLFTATDADARSRPCCCCWSSTKSNMQIRSSDASAHTIIRPHNIVFFLLIWFSSSWSNFRRRQSVSTERVTRRKSALTSVSSLLLLFLLVLSIQTDWNPILHGAEAAAIFPAANMSSSSSSSSSGLVVPSSSVATQPEHKTYPDLNVLLGGSAQLPCDLSPSGQLDPVMEHDDRGDIDREDDDEAVASSRSRNTSKPTEAFNADSIQLILWYHGDDISGSPFYSVDARSANDNKMMSMYYAKQQPQQPQPPRSQSSAEAEWQHFVMDPYNDRAKFDMHTSPSQLHLGPVGERDSGVYWCRVDYRWTRTTISKVRLNVLVPTKQLDLFRVTPTEDTVRHGDRWRHLVSVAQPNHGLYAQHNHSVLRVDIEHPFPMTFHLTSVSTTSSIIHLDEGVDALLACQAIGGNPLPSVLWFRNNRRLPAWRIIAEDVDTFPDVSSRPVLANLSGPIYQNGHRSVISLLAVREPGRADIGTLLRCQANSPDTQKPIIRLFKLDVNLRPQRAHIVDVARDSLTAGSVMYATCLTWGSRPPATIDWMVGERKLNDVKEIVFESNSTTKSVVRLVLSAEHNGRVLRCAARNPNINRTMATMLAGGDTGNTATMNLATTTTQGDRVSTTAASIEATLVYDQITLMVKFLPNVTLRVIDGEEAELRPEVERANLTTKLGARLALQCSAVGNPEPFKLRWIKNRKEIASNTQNGPRLMDGNRTLLLERVDRGHEGRYQCLAYNDIGRGGSNELILTVLRPPKCVFSAQPTIESTFHYSTNIFCQVDANPAEPVNIYWKTPQNQIFVSKSGKVLRLKAATRPGEMQTSFNVDDFDPEEETEDYKAKSLADPRITIASKGVRSRLFIRPQTVDDFGVYQCWAENEHGSNQAEPCMFNLTLNTNGGGGGATSNVPPRPVTDCTTNLTFDLLVVKCQHNSLNATMEREMQFHLLINRLDPSEPLVVNLTNPIKPVFLVQANLLHSNQIYQLAIFANNRFGPSDKVTMLIQPNRLNTSSTSSAGKKYPPDGDGNFFDDDLVEEDPDKEIEDDEGDDDDALLTNVINDKLNVDAEVMKTGGGGGKSEPSVPDLQKQNRLDDVSASHRLLVILITVLSVSLIVFSILLSIAIVLCVYRNKRATGDHLVHSVPPAAAKQPDTFDETEMDKEMLPISAEHCPDLPRQRAASILGQPSLAPDLIPCDAVYIFNDPEHGPVPNGVIHNNNVAPIYRDFVVDTAPNYYLAANQHHSNRGEPTTAAAVLEPKFLCQPNHVSVVNAGYISGQGNVQFVTTSSTPTNDTSSGGGGGGPYSFEASGVKESVQYSPYHLVNGAFALSIAEASVGEAPRPADLSYPYLSPSFSLSETSSDIIQLNNNSDTGELKSVEQGPSEHDPKPGAYLQTTTV